MGMQVRSQWLRWAELVRLGALFMAVMNAINAVLTLAGQLRTPDLVASPQYHDLSQQTRIIYIVGLVVMLVTAYKFSPGGGLWLTLAVSALRISDNLKPHVNWINCGMWATVALLGFAAFVTTWRARPRKETSRHATIAQTEYLKPIR